MKNIVEDYIKITKAQMKDSTVEIQEKNPNVDWQFLIGQALHVTKMQGRDDRIDIHLPINFSEDISKQLVVGTPNVEDKINEINAFLISNDLQYSWHVKDDLITGFDIKSYIDEEELSRPKFFEKWDKILVTSEHVKMGILRMINPGIMQTKTSNKISDSSIYQ